VISALIARFGISARTMVFCTLMACSVGADATEREEARALLGRIGDMDLRAPALERTRQIDALRTLALRTPALVKIRDHCVQAHAGLLAAEREQSQIAERLDHAGAAGLAEAELTQIAASVAHAGQTLKLAQAALPGCEQSTRMLTGVAR
jgi:hypothetical protein